MRDIVYSFQVSLDGYIEDASGSIDFASPDAELHQYFNDYEKAFDTHVYGRRLYEMMQYWETADQEDEPIVVEYAKTWQALEKVVFSRTLDSVTGNARLATQSLAEELQALKALHGKQIAIGGATLAAEAFKLGLIDRYHVVIYPILLGGGKRMFPVFDQPEALRLAETRVFESGCLALSYEKI
ncbi:MULTISPECIES: dihydrofolate reductase family protein [Exiguobacterium]|uniref:Dihydrofolate reductase family protein n=1 Tax=Exiguobacterium acetylicum TaxID=41170 RepID=A0ABX8G7V8_EXIAC|nr:MULTISPECIES: dihydrofolate reductase family protein [Exiguobacterium]QWB29461.1 dihydrofolate reductase family protein [Exiguobacterium acetylicum]